MGQNNPLGKKINSENVATVYGHKLPDDNDSNCFLFMEWIEGDTLNIWGKKLRSNCAWDKIRIVCEDIINGVMSLHEAGIMHRDIKPENIMVVSERAKVMDIGVAEITGNNEHTLHTTVKEFVGSMRYSSPQFIMGEKEFDYSDDVYSIGATFLELLTGSLPYQNVERKPVLPVVVVQGPPPVGELRETVPPAIKILIEGCLHPERDRRPTLVEILEVLKSDGQAPYIKTEIQRQAVDQRGYKVVHIDDVGGGFYADIGSDSLSTGMDYTVVRKSKPVHVPSLNAEVEPEMWVAKAELRHCHQSLGHFKFTKKSLVPIKPSGHDMLFGRVNNQWEEKDVKTLNVVIGDFVLKDNM